MSRPRVYGYPACGTCRKALAWLRERGIEVELVEITQQAPYAPIHVRLAGVSDAPVPQALPVAADGGGAGGDDTAVH